MILPELPRMTTEKTVGQLNASTVFEWVINDWKDLSRKGFSTEVTLYSPKFTTTHIDKNYEWQLRVFCQKSFFDRPNPGDIPDDTSGNDYHQFYEPDDETLHTTLSLINSSEADCRISFSLSLHERCSNCRMIIEEKCFKENTEIKDLNHALSVSAYDISGNIIVIRCVITFRDSKKELMEKEEIERGKEVAFQICDQYESLVDEEEFGRVLFTVEGKTIQVLKCVLAKRSPVFAAMLQHEMKEKLESTVEIEDMRHKVFKEMLRFMYTGKVSNVDEIADELLIAADRYALDQLKWLCGLSLYKNLNLDNAMNTLELADRYNVDELKCQTIKFIVSQIHEFMDKPEFKLLTRIPEFFLQVSKAIAKK